jgi:hypothetical protein
MCGDEQQDFITHQQLRGQSHPHDQAVNKSLAEMGFDKPAEETCVLCEEDGPAGLGAGCVLSVSVGGLFRRAASRVKR